MNGKHNELDKILKRLKGLGYSAAKVAKSIDLFPSQLSKIRAGLMTTYTDFQIQKVIDKIVEAYPEVKEYAEEVQSEESQKTEPGVKTGAEENIALLKETLKVKDENIALLKEVNKLTLSNIYIDDELKKMLEELEEIEKQQKEIETDWIKEKIKEIRKKQR